MGTIVAEYYGNRTDTESLIYPMHVEKDKAKRKELVEKGRFLLVPSPTNRLAPKFSKGTSLFVLFGNPMEHCGLHVPIGYVRLEKPRISCANIKRTFFCRLVVTFFHRKSRMRIFA